MLGQDPGALQTPSPHPSAQHLVSTLVLLNCHPDEKKINRHLVLICFNGLKVNLLQPKKPHFEAGVFSPADSNLSGEKAAPALPMTTAKPGGGRAEKVLSPEQLASLKAEVASAAKGSAAEKKRRRWRKRKNWGRTKRRKSKRGVRSSNHSAGVWLPGWLLRRFWPP